MRIIIEDVDFDSMRECSKAYGGMGDYFWDGEDLRIQVARNGISPNSGIMDSSLFLVAMHELVELKLCLDAGVRFEDIDRFDEAFGDKPGEPGDEPDAPYRDQHRKAMIMEHLLADWLGMKGYGRVE